MRKDAVTHPEPFVDTLGVERVVTRKDSKHLTLLKVTHTDYTTSLLYIACLGTGFLGVVPTNTNEPSPNHI